MRLPFNRFTPPSPLFPNTFTSILAIISYVWSIGTTPQVVSSTLAFNPPNLPKLCNQLLFPNTSFTAIPSSSLLEFPADTSKSTRLKLKISHHFHTPAGACSQFSHPYQMAAPALWFPSCKTFCTLCLTFFPSLSYYAISEESLSSKPTSLPFPVCQHCHHYLHPQHVAAAP